MKSKIVKYYANLGGYHEKIHIDSDSDVGIFAVDLRLCKGTGGQNLCFSGITDKLSCYAYIASINFNIETKYKINKLNKDIYKICYTIVNIFHELYDAICSIIFIKGTNKNLIFSPKNSEEEENEEHLNFIPLLFGKNIDKLDLLECLYIMNDINYKQNIKEFRKNFKKIRQIVKEAKGNTDFIKIKNDKFKKFYDNSIQDIEEIIQFLASKCITVKYKGTNNNDSEDEYEDYIPNKCGIMGGKKAEIIISKNN